jgi:hypothetical protein
MSKPSDGMMMFVGMATSLSGEIGSGGKRPDSPRPPEIIV